MERTAWTAAGSFFKSLDFDFEARDALGAAGVGIGDVGLVLATLDRVEDGDCQGWFDAWTATAGALADRGRAALAQGHVATASWAFLAAAQYHAKALGMIDGLADQSGLLPAFRAHRACWEGVLQASEGRFVPLDVPYEGATLPGYLLRPDTSGTSRPTFVMTNGSDGSLPGLMGYGAAEALARGWNVFLYDGPGQQSMLFERNVPFRPDWEAVLTPVIDALLTRPEVDPERLVGYGVSQAGFWLSRAIAFEHRLQAAVVDPGVVDVSTSWLGNLPPPLIQLLDAGQRSAFDEALVSGMPQDDDGTIARTFAFRARPYGITDPFDVFSEVRRYHVRDVASQITTPLLITDPEDEQFWPGQSAQMHQLVAGSTLLAFTRHDGANFHCQPAGRRLTQLLMFDWLQSRLSST